SVVRTQINAVSSAPILKMNQKDAMMLKTTCPQNEPNMPVQKPTAVPGPDQPPRKSAVATAETMVMLPYSPRKNMAQRRPLYSVRNPATSSDSASGRSKGERFVSARPQM